MNATTPGIRIFVSAVCSAVIATAAVGFPPRATVHAQDPIPTAFMHNVVPTFPEPDDGASVLVVEGVGAGLGGCTHRPGITQQEAMDEIVSSTVASVNSHRPTITEISPQAPCAANIQDWKDVVLEIVTRVETDTGGLAATWWGGIMLDEESGAQFGFSRAELENLNSSVYTLMQTTPGISWYYTETFAGAGAWSQADFNAITGASRPAPQIATTEMVSLVNAFYQSTPQPILVTWSLSPGYPNKYFDSMVYSSSWIQGPPYTQWLLNLSNCFIGADSVCNDWDHDGAPNSIDGDSDEDACDDTFEVALSQPIDRLAPWDFYSVPVPSLLWTGGDPYGREKDAAVAAADAQAVFSYFTRGAQTGTVVYEQDLNGNGVKDGWEYDRRYLAPLRSGPPDGVIAAGDAQMAFSQYAAAYFCY